MAQSSRSNGSNKRTRRGLPSWPIAYQFRFERLEDRTAPANFTWTGAVNSNLSNPGNWQGGVAPTGAVAADDQLTFPVGGRPAVNNDLPTPVFTSLIFDGSNYTLSGGALRLGRSGTPSGSAAITVNSGITGVTIDTPTRFNSGEDQSVFVNAGGNLRVTGVLTNTAAASSQVTKRGVGELTLAGDNAAYTGTVNIVEGLVTLTHRNALGTPGTLGGVGGTTVQTGAQLRTSGIAGNINEALVLNGSGVAQNGALLNLAGNNIWAGPIRLNTLTTFIGSFANANNTGSTRLQVTGRISDAGSGQGLVKVGRGELELAPLPGTDGRSGNTYRGLTNVRDGVLTIANGQALGQLDDPTQQGTIVERNPQAQTGGQLRIGTAAGNGFTVLNERLTLNGDGPNGIGSGLGSLFNAFGDNVWASSITMGSLDPDGQDVTVGATVNTNLTIHGELRDRSPNPVPISLQKVAGGRVILTNNNSFTGFILVSGGFLTARDSRALGPANSSVTRVTQNATLELEVENGDEDITQKFAPSTFEEPGFQGGIGLGTLNGRDLSSDFNPMRADPGEPLNSQNQLTFRENLILSGEGFDRTGALRSVTGQNTWVNPVSLWNDFIPFGGASGPSAANPLAAPRTAIGAEADPRIGFPTPSALFLANDYSLTITGRVQDFDGPTSPPAYNLDTAGNVVGRYPAVLVKRGFGNLILPNANTYTGGTNVEQGWITVRNNDSLGVDLPFDPRTLFITGINSQLGGPSLIIFNGTQYLGPTQQPPVVVSAGAAVHLWPAAGNLTLNENFILQGTGLDDAPDTGLARQSEIPTRFNLLRAKGALMSLAGNNLLTGDIQFNGQVGLGVQQVDTNVGQSLTLTGNLSDFVFPNTSPPAGGFRKLGERELVIEAAGSYSGAVNVDAGTLRVRSDTALGRHSNGTLDPMNPQQASIRTDTTVAVGATLQLDSNPNNERRATAAADPTALQVIGERLILSAPGRRYTVAGPLGTPNLGQYTLTLTTPGTPFPNGPSLSVTTDPIAITATAAQVRTALATATGLPETDFIVTRSPGLGDEYTISFAGSLADDLGIDFRGDPVLGSGSTIRFSGSDQPLQNLSMDNAWRGPVELASGMSPDVYAYTRIETVPNTRLQLLGAVSDAGSPMDLFKTGNGAITLGGRESEPSTYAGTTTILAGVVTAAKGTAFGSPAGETVLANGTQLQLQGSLVVAGERLTVLGSGPDAAAAPTGIVPQWLDVGPAGTNNGVTPNPDGVPISGRVTGTATDPGDPNHIYITTAGGGAWRTRDGGKTWVPLFDSLSGLPQQAALWGGSIAVAPTDPNVVYYGTGEPNHQFDSFYGTGVYKSTNAGRTWELLTDDGTPAGNNPFNGLVVSKIAVDPRQGGQNNIFVAASTLAYYNRAATPGPLPMGNPVQGAATTGGTPGIWRFDPVGAPRWSNTTAVVPASRMPTATPAGPGTPGPIDTFAIDFPQSDAAWTDLQIILVDLLNGPNSALQRSPGQPLPNGTDPRSPVLFAALGTPTVANRRNQDPANMAFRNNQVGGPVYSSAVYRNENPFNIPGFTGNTPTVIPSGWFIGDSGRIDTTGSVQPVQPNSTGLSSGPGSNGYPTQDTVVPPSPPTFPPAVRNGNIKFSVFVPAVGGLNARPTSYPTLATIAVYSVNTFPVDPNRTGLAGTRDTGRPLWNTFREVLYWGGNLQGKTWRLVNGLATTPATDFLSAQGYFNLAIGATERGTFIVGGDARLIQVSGAVTGAGAPAATPTLTDINTSLANGPHNQYHSVTPVFDQRQATGKPLVRTLIGTDGGLWSLEPGSPDTWINRNGDLQTQLVNSLDVNPTDIGIVYAGTQDTGAIRYDGNLAWTQLDRTSNDRDRGTTRVNPLNPNIIYQTVRRGAVGGPNGGVRRSMDGGQTWTDLNGLNPVLPSLLAGAVPLPRAFNPNLPNPLFGVGVELDPKSPPPGEIPGYFPLALDTVNPLRLFVGGRFDPTNDTPAGALNDYPSRNPINRANNGTPLQFSFDGGNSWFPISPMLLGLNRVSLIALATNQGPFVEDPAFTEVFDILSNTYDPGTIYAVDGNAPGYGASAVPAIRVTKNSGQTWATRSIPGLDAQDRIVDLVVDAGNRDTVYAVTQGAPGSGRNRVFRTTDAGRTWTNITGGQLTGLNDVPFHKIVVDPRVRVGTGIDFGDLYLGTDNGVFRSLNGEATNWARYGTGMPQVAVRDLVLNQQLGTLTAATYGRGVMQLTLPDIQADRGAIRAVSGSSVWGGEIELTGNTTIDVAGSQAVQNGITPATLNVTGVISSIGTLTAANTFTKIGQGNLILSGPNTYINQTRIQEGVLTAGNRTALGSPDGNTVVSGPPIGSPIGTAGAALQLQADLDAEPVVLNGGGVPFNGHWTGALRNISGNNLFTGTLTLGTGLTPPSQTTVISPVGQTMLPPGVSQGVVVGVDASTSLRIAPDQANLMTEPGNVIGSVNLVKELTGTLILGGDNDPSFSGQIDVIQGALQAQSDEALGTAAVGTRVFDGAQLQLATNVDTGAAVTIAAEPLTLSGGGGRDGSGNPTGALQNVAGNNFYNGPITLDSVPNFFPTTIPSLQVAFGVLEVGDTLTVGGVISEATMLFGIDKVGVGRLTLDTAAANTYAGPTRVQAGALRARNNASLGTTGSGTTVSRGAALEVDGDGLMIPEPVTLTGSGTPTDQAGALRNIGTGTNEYAGLVTLTNDLLPANTAEVAVGADPDGRLNVTAVVQDTQIGAPMPAVTNPSALAPLTDGVGSLGFSPLPSATLVKLGGGTVALSNTNTYTGLTRVDNGVLAAAGKPAALGRTTNLDREIQRITVTGSNGRFAITFNGFTNGFTRVNPTGTTIAPSTNPAMWFEFDNNAGIAPTETVVAAALNALVSINTPYPGQTAAGEVQVRRTAVPGGFAYDIFFDRELGFVNVDPLTTSVNGGVTAGVTVLKDGPQGTVVSAGGTLQLEGVTYINEALQLTGDGFNHPTDGPLGALRVGPGSTATWGEDVGPAVGSITLLGNASLGAAAGGTLEIDQTILQKPAGTPADLDTFGPGVVRFTGTLANTYTGDTQVNEGTLELTRTGAGVNAAVPGSLTVGNGIGAAGSAVALLTESEQIANASAVTVLADGLFDVNGRTETVGPTAVTTGTVTTGGTGTGLLTVASLNLTGGFVNAAAAGERVVVAANGGITARPDATAPAVIAGDGQLDLGTGTHTLTVTNGTLRAGLLVDTVVAGTGTLVKAGAGRAVARETNTFSGTVRLNAGDFELSTTGSLPAASTVQLNGGTLSGDGTAAGTVTQGATGGVISPGEGGTVGSPDPTGILNVGPTTLGSTSTLVLDIGDLSGNRVPGEDYDRLAVTGSINLNNAVLTGTVGAGVAVGESFTVVTTTAANGVIGTFRDAVSGVPVNRVFLSGLRFNVQYRPNSVVLTRVLNQVNLSVAPIAPLTITGVNPLTATSEYGQALRYTVSVVPETGSAPLPAGSQVTVQLRNILADPFMNPLDTQVLTLSGAGTATYTVPAGLLDDLIASQTYAIDLSYTGDGSTFPTVNNAPTAIIQEVNPATTAVGLALSINPSLFGQPVTVTGTVAAVPPAGSTPETRTPTAGTIQFFVDGNPVGGPRTIVNGVASVVLPVLSVSGSPHTVEARFTSGDANFQNSLTGNTTTVTVNPTATDAVVTVTPPTGRFGQARTINVTVNPVAPGAGVPTGTVTFFQGPISDNVVLGTSTNLTGNTYSLPLGTLPGGTYPITVRYVSNDGNFQSDTGSITVTVDPAATTTTLDPNLPTTDIFGTDFVLRATVAGLSGFPLPQGTVTFRDGGRVLGTVPLTDVGGTATAMLTLNPGELRVGNRSITATYNPAPLPADQNYAASTSAPLGVAVSLVAPAVTSPARQTFVNADTFTITGNTNPSVGIFVRVFTDSNGNGRFDPGIDQQVGGRQLTAGARTFSISVPLEQDAANQFFVTSGDGANPTNQSPATVAGLVVEDSTLPAVGDGLTADNPFLSTTNGNRPSSTTVTADIGDTSPTTYTLVITGPNANLPTFTGTGPTVRETWDGRDTNGNVVADGVYTLTLTPTDAAGNVGAPIVTTVTVFNGTAGVAVASNSPSVFGTPARFTATLSVPFAQVADFLPGETVEFFDGGTSLGTAPVVRAGSAFTATLNTTALPVGTYSITARLLAGGDFSPVTSAAVTHSVTPAATSVVLTGGPPSVYGDEVVFTAVLDSTVRPPLVGSTVEFYNGDTLLGSAAVVAGANGVPTAVFRTTALPAGTFSDINARSVPGPNFLPARSNPVIQQVSPATLQVRANDTTSVFGDPAPAIELTITGLKNNDPTSVVTGAAGTTVTPATPVGAYPIGVGTLTANSNYAVVFTAGVLTVTPAPLTITADSFTRTVDQPNPPLTATFTGLRNADTAAVVSGLTLVTTATATSPAGVYPVTTSTTPTAANYTITFVPGAITTTAAPSFFAVGSGTGFDPVVNLYNPDGSRRSTNRAFAEPLRGGVRVATGDFNGDGFDDMVVGTGPGAVTQVRILDGRDGSELFAFQPFEEDFLGGVYVAAGDINGDGVPDLVVTPDEGGGPRARVLDGARAMAGQIVLLADFFAIDDPDFRGGARPAVGDIDGDGFGDLIVSAGFGGGPRVAVFNGAVLSAGGFQRVMPDFFAFEPALRNGAFVAAGDLNGDGKAELIAGGGPGGGPRVVAFDGAALVDGGRQQLVVNFFGGDTENRGGIRVAYSNPTVGSDTGPRLIVGAGDSGGSLVTTYPAESILLGGPLTPSTQFVAFNDLVGGVFVG